MSASINDNERVFTKRQPSQADPTSPRKRTKTVKKGGEPPTHLPVGAADSKTTGSHAPDDGAFNAGNAGNPGRSDPRVDEKAPPPFEVESNNYYERLGVPNDASADTIQQAVRRLQRRYHPDKNLHNHSQCTAFTATLHHIRDTLMDSQRRKQYDKGLRIGAKNKQRQAPPRADDPEMAEWKQGVEELAEKQHSDPRYAVPPIQLSEQLAKLISGFKTHAKKLSESERKATKKTLETQIVIELDQRFALMQSHGTTISVVDRQASNDPRVLPWRIYRLRDDFQRVFQDAKVTLGKARPSLAMLWLKHAEAQPLRSNLVLDFADRKSAQLPDFIPVPHRVQYPESTCNVPEVDAKQAQPLFDFIHECIDNADDFIKEFAYALRHPGMSTNRVVGLNGPQQTGKTHIIKLLIAPHGRTWIHWARRWPELVGGPKHIRKDVHLKSVICYDEVDVKQARLYLPDIKAWIQGHPLSNGCLHESFKVLVSDADVVVPVGEREERFKPFRFHAPVVAPDYAALLTIPVEAIAKYLYQVDLTGFNPRHVPRTDSLQYHKMVQIGKTCSTQHWWMHALHSKRILGWRQMEHWPSANTPITVDQLIAAYCAATKKTVALVNRHDFVRTLSRVAVLRQQTADPEVLLLGTLEECHAKWRKFTSTPNWNFSMWFDADIPISASASAPPASPPSVAQQPTPPPAAADKKHVTPPPSAAWRCDAPTASIHPEPNKAAVFPPARLFTSSDAAYAQRVVDCVLQRGWFHRDDPPWTEHGGKTNSEHMRQAFADITGLTRVAVGSDWKHYADLMWPRFRGGTKPNKDNSQQKVKGTSYRLPSIALWRSLQQHTPSYAQLPSATVGGV